MTTRRWVDWVGVMLGAWLIASPWMFGFAGSSAAAMNAVVSGLLVFGYALWGYALWAMRIDITSRTIQGAVTAAGAGGRTPV